MNEIKWLPVIGFEDTYIVSEYGDIKRIKYFFRSTKYGLIDKKANINKGYKYIRLYKNKKNLNYSIASLVAAAFIGERPDNYVIDHIDGNKINNHYSNLEYVTRKENTLRAINIGLTKPIKEYTHLRGKNAHIKQIKKNEKIEEIKLLITQGLKIKQIAKIYNVSRNTIHSYLKIT